MINKDYEFLEGILDPTVKLNKENNTISYVDSNEISIRDTLIITILSLEVIWFKKRKCA